jgi:hypothetical protein
MRGVALLLSGLVLGLGVGLAAPNLDFGLTVGARPATPAGTVVQWVDRTHKADRLDISVTRVGREPTPPQQSHKLMDGCEPAASPLSASAQIAARCAA